MRVGDCRVDTQIDAHIGKKEGMEAGCPPRGLPGAHWGKALRMAFTSSATAVRANSNWSWGGRARGRSWVGLASALAPMGRAFGGGELGTPLGRGKSLFGGGTEAGGRGRLLLASLGKGGIKGWDREEQSP